MTFRTLFGAVLVLVLLVLYVLLAKSAIELLGCTPQADCHKQFTEIMASALATIGGLVSAVVIAELAITVPKNPPFRHLLGESPSARQLILLRIMTFLYLGTWVGVGLWVLIATWEKPDVIPALTALARSWFGLAVAAGYAFFGLKPA